MYQVALFLDSEGVKIGRLAKTNIYQDKSMIERLSAPVIDVEGVVEHHKLLVAKVLRQREIFEQIVDDNLLTEGDSFVVVEGK